MAGTVPLVLVVPLAPRVARRGGCGGPHPPCRPPSAGTPAAAFRMVVIPLLRCVSLSPFLRCESSPVSPLASGSPKHRAQTSLQCRRDKRRGMRLSELARGLALSSGDVDPEISGHHRRQPPRAPGRPVRRGVPASALDGHAYIPKAIAQGASAVAVERAGAVPPNVPCIRVPSAAARSRIWPRGSTVRRPRRSD